MNVFLMGGGRDSTTKNFLAVARKFSRPRLVASLASSASLHLSHLTTLLHKTKNTSKSLYFLYVRRGRDSNSRYPFGYSSFQDWCIQPLCHLSILYFIIPQTFVSLYYSKINILQCIQIFSVIQYYQ